MKRCEYRTNSGTIVYWINEWQPDRLTLIFLPGLTATHRLFEKQLENFDDRYNCLVWDAPGHGESAPFILNFDLEEEAGWLSGIIQQENIHAPILVGQSMGGYVAQMFMECFPGSCGGFVSIDSCPLKKRYVGALDVRALQLAGALLPLFPWKLLKETTARRCARTPYGQELMGQILDEWEKDSYCKVSAHGFRMITDARRRNLEYAIDCPALLICGSQDQVGFVRRYNDRWQKGEQLPLFRIKGAGHNSNTDAPAQIDQLIEAIAYQVKKKAAE